MRASTSNGDRNTRGSSGALLAATAACGLLLALTLLAAAVDALLPLLHAQPAVIAVAAISS